MDIANLRSLVGAAIAAARVEELALYGPDDAPVFSDPRLPFVQALVLEFDLVDGRTIRFIPVQNDDDWSMFAVWSGPDKPSCVSDLSSSILRARTMVEFPAGRIEAIESAPDGPGHRSITLRIDGRDVILCAGEVYENIDNSLTIHQDDESVLVFLHAEAYRRTIFRQPFFLE